MPPAADAHVGVVQAAVPDAGRLGQGWGRVHGASLRPPPGDAALPPSRLARDGAVGTAKWKDTFCSVEPLSPRKCPSTSRHRRCTGLGAQRKARGHALRCLRVCDPDQGGPSFLLTRWVKTREALATSTSAPACPFGHWMWGRREPGRWPACETYPPGGGCGVLAVLDGPGFSVRSVATARALEGVLEEPRAQGAARAIDRRGAHRKSTDPGVTPCTSTRRRADRSRNLATFHAGSGLSSRVRRDARDRPSVATCVARVSQTRSARKMVRLGPDRTRASIEARGRGPSVGRPSRHAPAVPRSAKALSGR